MSSIGTGYDLSASQFSPDGRVFQVEYAHKALENSGTALAIRGRDGVVFAVEKIVVSKLYEVGANKRIFTVDKHIGVAVAGLLADARQVVETARSEASSYRSDYHSAIPLRFLKDRLALYMHAYTLYSSVRPFGCSLLLGSFDPTDGAQLYCVEPSGTSWGYLGCAIGKAAQARQDGAGEAQHQGHGLPPAGQGGRPDHLRRPRRGQGQELRARAQLGLQGDRGQARVRARARLPRGGNARQRGHGGIGGRRNVKDAGGSASRPNADLRIALQ
ncbi:hypothetical protein HPB48_018457 [Haemaphysalis longicornis]|uniref:Proteasome subunit alpha type n=1 Tax=Haemaphysalis longicornis TaxID=44386 RepID=A0A9J6FXS7_HAELO|nr:hypothetical protein HPB48_018457 [Haemaphysalis longicornis]